MKEGKRREGKGRGRNEKEGEGKGRREEGKRRERKRKGNGRKEGRKIVMFRLFIITNFVGLVMNPFLTTSLTL
jgi:hypothetical protein